MRPGEEGTPGWVPDSGWVRLALAGAKVVAWKWNPADGTVQLEGYGSARLPRISGPMSREQLLPLIHPDHVERFEKQWDESVQAGSPFRLEFRLAAAPGASGDSVEDRWMSIRGAPAPDGSIAGVAQDITDRKRAEHEFISHERLYRRIVESVAEAICILDTEGRIQFANRPASLLTGYSLDEIQGRPIFDAVFPNDVEEAKRRFERRRSGAADRYEIRVKRKDGSAIWLDIASAPMLDDAGRFAGSLLLATDITERKNSEAELARQRDALERSNADLQQFAYATSHDLQEPLRTINSYVQLLQQRYESAFDPEGREFMAFITGSVQRMDRLIRDLLAFSRVVSTDASLMADTPLTGAVQWAMMNLQRSIVENEADIRFGDLPAVYGDPSQLTQLFQNLIGNAIKYRSAAKPVIEIFSCPGEPGEWRISVRDNGIGIAPAYHEPIFGLFKRLHGHEYPGTGLGLAICKRIVEHHRGRIWVESEAGKGATFHFTLPS